MVDSSLMFLLSLSLNCEIRIILFCICLSKKWIDAFSIFPVPFCFVSSFSLSQKEILAASIDANKKEKKKTNTIILIYFNNSNIKLFFLSLVSLFSPSKWQSWRSTPSIWRSSCSRPFPGSIHECSTSRSAPSLKGHASSPTPPECSASDDWWWTSLR